MQYNHTALGQSSLTLPVVNTCYDLYIFCNISMSLQVIPLMKSHSTEYTPVLWSQFNFNLKIGDLIWRIVQQASLRPMA